MLVLLEVISMQFDGLGGLGVFDWITEYVPMPNKKVSTAKTAATVLIILRMYFGESVISRSQQFAPG